MYTCAGINSDTNIKIDCDRQTSSYRNIFKIFVALSLEIKTKYQLDKKYKIIHCQRESPRFLINLRYFKVTTSNINTLIGIIKDNLRYIPQSTLLLSSLFPMNDSNIILIFIIGYLIFFTVVLHLRTHLAWVSSIYLRDTVENWIVIFF